MYQEKNEKYNVTDKEIEESIVQEVYIRAGFKTAICLLILNTGAEITGIFSPVNDDQDLVVKKKEARKDALKKVRENLESISNWKKTIDAINEEEAKQRQQAKKDTEEVANSNL